MYEKLSHTADDQLDVNRSPLSQVQSISEMIVDPRLFGERYNEVSSMEHSEATKSTGASVTNIHPDNIFSLPAVYAAVCIGVARNLVNMAPPEVTFISPTEEIFGYLIPNL